MKHEFNLLVQIEFFLSDNFPGCISSYIVSKKYGKESARLFRSLKFVEHSLRSGLVQAELDSVDSSCDCFSPCDGCEPNYINACSSCQFASPSINESLNSSSEG